LNPLGVFLHTCIQCIWSIMSAFLRSCTPWLKGRLGPRSWSPKPVTPLTAPEEPAPPGGAFGASEVADRTSKLLSEKMLAGWTLLGSRGRRSHLHPPLFIPLAIFHTKQTGGVKMTSPCAATF
jgi:hypothetical protein